MTEQEEAKKKEDQDNEEMLKLEEILLDEKKCQEVQNKVTAAQIDNFITDQVDAAGGKEGTDFDELD